MCEEFCPSFPREHPTWHSPICLFLPMPSSEYFCLFSSWCLHHSSTYGRSVLPACYLHMSTPIFASISASLCQTLSELLKCPSTGAHPTASTQNGPEWDPKGTNVRAQIMCNWLTSRGKNVATRAGSDQQVEGGSNNSKCWVTNEYC